MDAMNEMSQIKLSGGFLQRFNHNALLVFNTVQWWFMYSGTQRNNQNFLKAQCLAAQWGPD